MSDKPREFFIMNTPDGYHVSGIGYLNALSTDQKIRVREVLDLEYLKSRDEQIKDAANELPTLQNYVGQAVFAGQLREGFIKGAQWSDANPVTGDKWRGIAERMAESQKNFLKNVACDWYVDKFRKDTTPTGASTGIAKIFYNKELEQRAFIAFEELREALSEYQKAIGK